MVAFQGMDVEVVRSVANGLNARSHDLTAVVGAVDGLVAHLASVWAGPDAQQFAQWWQQEHKPRLVAAAEAVHGLGQSASNNASEQDHASGGSGSAGHAAAAAHAPSAATATPAPTASSAVHAASGSLPASSREEYLGGAHLHAESAGWAQGPPANGQADQWGKAAYNCTSWAAFRRSDLGLDVPGGNGGAMGHDSSLPPTLGAIASYGSGVDPDWGHVMVVEQVMSPDQFRVSEMNYDNQGGFRDTQVWDRISPTTWRSESTGAVRTIKFTP